MLKTNFNEFYKGIDKEIKSKQKKAKRVLKNTALNFLDEVQENSPVKSGQYQSGHILSKDNPSGYKPRKGQPTSEYRGQTKKNKDNAEGILDNVKEGERARIFVTNNVDHAGIIEHGGSGRTPHLVYEKAKMKNNRFYEEEKRKNGL